MVDCQDEGIVLQENVARLKPEAQRLVLALKQSRIDGQKCLKAANLEAVVGITSNRRAAGEGGDQNQRVRGYILRECIERGVPVCACGQGYFYPYNQAEVWTYMASLSERKPAPRILALAACPGVGQPPALSLQFDARDADVALWLARQMESAGLEHREHGPLDAEGWIAAAREALGR